MFLRLAASRNTYIVIPRDPVIEGVCNYISPFSITLDVIGSLHAPHISALVTEHTFEVLAFVQQL